MQHRYHNRDFVDATINAAMAKDKIPGVSISVSGPAGSYTKAYGVSDLSKKTPQNVNNHFRIGSITKLFTAHAILVEVDKGTIKLDDTVDKYLQGIQTVISLPFANCSLCAQDFTITLPTSCFRSC